MWWTLNKLPGKSHLMSVSHAFMCTRYMFIFCSYAHFCVCAACIPLLAAQVQLVSGASPLAYWMSAYIWDVLLFFILTVLVMLAFAAYGRDASKVKIWYQSDTVVPQSATQ